jgi:predicted membrane metal-binding protein
MAGLLASFLSLPGDSTFRIVPAALFVGLLILCLLVPAKAKYPLCLFLFFCAGSLLELSNRQSSALVALAEQQERVTIEATVLEPPVFREETTTAVVRVDRLQGMESGKAVGKNQVPFTNRRPPLLGAAGSLSARLRSSTLQQSGPVRLCAGRKSRPFLRCLSGGWRRIVPGKRNLGFL